MSLLALAAARKQLVGDFGAKFLLILLADRHNADTGDCHPSIQLLVQESEMGHRTVSSKLDLLEAGGFIARRERARQDGGRAPSQYDLLFLDPEDRPVAAPVEKAARPTLPPLDFTPKPETIERIKQEFPHHDVEESIAGVVREWVDYCHAADRKYARHDHAFANSARRHYQRRSAQPSPMRQAASLKPRATGGLAGAVSDLLAGRRA